MRLNWLGFGLGLPLYDAISDSGGGGGSLDSGGSPSAPSDAPAEPSGPIDLADTAQVRFSGSDKPMSVKDIRGFQAQWTKASQRAAQLERDLQARDARLAEYERQRQAAAAREQQGRQGPAQPDIAAQLESLTYLDGPAAAQVVRNIQAEFQNRDRILLGALQQMKQMQGILSQLNESHTNTGFDSKVNSWIRDGGYPDNDTVRNLMKEIYLAYEGDNLDQEFPDMFKSRWDSLLSLIDQQRQQATARARQTAFVPGKGGGTGPSRPLQIDPRASAQETANILWEAMQNGSGT